MDQPRERLPQDAARLVHGQFEGVDLIRLDEMLGPVREDDEHENLHRAFVPRTVESCDDALHLISNRRARNGETIPGTGPCPPDRCPQMTQLEAKTSSARRGARANPRRS